MVKAAAQLDLFRWVDSSLPPMAALHERIRLIPAGAALSDWWEPACDGQARYCLKHFVFFGRRKPCWLCKGEANG